MENNKDTGNKKAFSLENYLDQKKTIQVLDMLNPKTVFEQGFGAYKYVDGIFLNLKMKTYVKTTCPINNSEDIIKVKIKYRLNRFGECIEHHSFLAWLDSFENMGLGLEATVDTIYLMIDKVCSPTQLRVEAESHSNYRSKNFAKREKK